MPCQTKRAYEHHRDAKQAQRRIRSWMGGHLYVYACPYGHGWHLTKQARGRHG